MSYNTTFNLAKLNGACGQQVGCGFGYDKIATSLGGTTAYGKDTPINILTVLSNSDFDTATWCLCATIEDASQVNRLLAVDFANTVLSVFENEFPNDTGPRNALTVAQNFANGTATSTDLANTRDAVTASISNTVIDSYVYFAALAAKHAADDNAATAVYYAGSAAIAVKIVQAYSLASPTMKNEEVDTARNNQIAILANLLTTRLS